MNGSQSFQLDGVTVRRHGKPILGPISHEIGGSGITMVLGPNGAGKTTFLRVLHGIETPTAGTMKIESSAVSEGQRQSFVFQSPILLRRSVVANAIYPLEVRGITNRKADQIATERLRAFGFGDRFAIPAGSLSGGEKQILALARALVTDPDVLFLDEPTSSVDGRTTRIIEEALVTEARRGTKVIMATHDFAQARRLANDVIFMVGGQVLESGPASDFFNGPSTSEAKAFLSGEIVE